MEQNGKDNAKFLKIRLDFFFQLHREAAVDLILN